MQLHKALLILTSAAFSQTLPNAVPMPTPEIQYLNSAGQPLAGAKLCTYSAGTTTPLATYTDSTAATPNSNPVILDVAGRASVWIGPQLYKFVLRVGGDGTCSTGAVQWSQDNVSDSTLYFVNYVKSAGTATLITYTPPYSGSSTTTVSAKLSEVLSVEDYGAKCDGTTDDTAPITAAIAGASAFSGTGNAAVALPHGVCVVSNISAVSHVYFIANGTTLKQKASSTNPMLLFSSVTNSGIIGSITLNGNKTAQGALSNQDCIRITGSSASLTFDDIYTSNAMEDGIYIGLSGSTPSKIDFRSVESASNNRNGVSITNAQGVHFGRLVTHDNNGSWPQDGIDIEPNVFSDLIESIDFDYLEAYNNTGAGINVIGKYSNGPQHMGVTIKRLSSHNNGLGIVVEVADGVQVLGGQVYLNTVYGWDSERDIRNIRASLDVYSNASRGISLALNTQSGQSYNVDFSGTRSYNNSTGGAGSADGFYLSSDNASDILTRVSCWGCVFFDNQSAHTQRYGITIGSNVSNVDGAISTFGNLSGNTGARLAVTDNYLSIDGTTYLPNANSTTISVGGTAIFGGNVVIQNAAGATSVMETAGSAQSTTPIHQFFNATGSAALNITPYMGLELLSLQPSFVTADSGPNIYRSAGGGSPPFDVVGNLIIQGRSSGGTGGICLATGDTSACRISLDNAGDLFIWDVAHGAISQVSMGAANSGGTGYKVLRVAN